MTSFLQNLTADTVQSQSVAGFKEEQKSRGYTMNPLKSMKDTDVTFCIDP